jgi:6-phosphogluconolactonase
MKITRRCFFSALFCLLAILPAFPQTPNQKFLAFVGTYTDKTESKGIYAYEFDTATGKLTPKGLAAETSNPSWLVIHPNGKWAYAANESGKQSTVSAFSIDAKSAKLTFLNQLPALGEDPCYLSLDKTGKFLFVANYTSGNVVVFPILPNGKLGKHTALQSDQGTLGPNKERQDTPHAHWVEAGGNNLSIDISDLGLDLILIYSFDVDKGSIHVPDSPFVGHKSEGPYTLRLHPGTGPRHLTGYGRFLYVLGELQSTVTVFQFNRMNRYEEIQHISTLPNGFSGRNDAAEIAVHTSGKWLFASNRGHDSIAVFAIDLSVGTLRPAGYFSTGGKEPRHFAIDPTGRFLLAENQNSNSIVVFRIDPATGALSRVSTIEGVPSPVCLTFYPAR